MAAQPTGPGGWMPQGGDSPEIKEFWERLGSVLTEIALAIEKAGKQLDGNTLILLEATLAGLQRSIIDIFQQKGLRIVVEQDQNPPVS
jgi:hypothetical protein